ncbi:ankyrin repeat-containing protein DDB_G0279043-like isoform X1 [Ylistrum balloti]|uniref:ankyrin repeat-containing protein DDB_G0279043-like isoform X1 n=1 Tax=Ylistrum balloti TaxID=509963 RepID=UPI002905C895|nr:ankyrin repeat-containing protein DDB_G0279043-like isoform X1 [Ylistrum balloti]
MTDTRHGATIAFMDEDCGHEDFSSSTDELLKTQFPMHHACRDGDLETLSRLLSSGSYNLYEEDGLYGWTPVHWAAHFGKLACLRKLTSLSNDGTLCHHATSRFGQTPLHLASLRDQPHCAQWIIQTGANVEVQDYLGETPIHKAARTGSMECVSLLVSQGCKLSIRNHNNQTPSQVAAECGYQECANYLERATQMQQQAEGVYNELRMPVTQTNQSNSNMIPNGVNGNRTVTDPNLIMQGLNGGVVPGQTGEDNTADCEMDMAESIGDGCMQGEAAMFFRAGMKRGRDDLEEECFKRMRRAEPIRPIVCDVGYHDSSIINSYNAILSISTDPMRLPDAVLDSVQGQSCIGSQRSLFF